MSAQGQHQHAEHAVGAVDQGQALLGPQRRPGPGRPRPARRRRAAAAPSTSQTSPSPISTRATWARGARSPLRPSEPCSCTTGRDAGVEQGQQPLDDLRAHARAAHGQGAGPQQHHGPHHLALDRRAHAGGVRADERALQLGASLAGRCRVGQRAEPGGDAVDRLVGGEEPLDERRAGRHGLPGGRRRASPCARPRATRTTSSALEPVVGHLDLGVGGHGRQCSDGGAPPGPSSSASRPTRRAGRSASYQRVGLETDPASQAAIIAVSGTDRAWLGRTCPGRPGRGRDARPWHVPAATGGDNGADDAPDPTARSPPAAGLDLVRHRHGRGQQARRRDRGRGRRRG